MHPNLLNSNPTQDPTHRGAPVVYDKFPVLSLTAMFSAQSVHVTSNSGPALFLPPEHRCVRVESSYTMQYYTKQELQGAARYTGKCRIGNWNENDTLDEVRDGSARL